MSKHNPVHQVLITKGNQAVLEGNKTVADLLPGQIGIFDYDTNLSLDGSKKVRNFYMAVGLDTDGDGVTDDIKKSRGSHIQGKNISQYTFRGYTPGRSMKVKLKDYVAKCDNEYGIKVGIRNAEISKMLGFNEFVKTFAMRTECCNGCKQLCPNGDANQITKDLFIQISNDPSKLITATITPRGDVSAAGVTPQDGKLTLEDLEKIMKYNATKDNPDEFVYTDLEIEAHTLKVAKACGINLNHFYPREGILTVTKVGDFECSGEIEVTQTAVIEEGSGLELRQMEEFTLGWDETPYRVSCVTGFPIQREYLSDVNGKYDMLYLGYDQVSSGAWQDYEYGEGTHIAIPCADTTTRDALVTLLDALNIVPFDALLDDAQNVDVDPSVVESTSAIDDVNKDGLG